MKEKTGKFLGGKSQIYLSAYPEESQYRKMSEYREK